MTEAELAGGAPKKKQRTLSYNRLVGALHVRRGGAPEVGYWVDQWAHDLGAAVRAFRLTKIVRPADGEPDHYDVTISAEGDACECRGFLRWQHCKHADAMRFLIGRGVL